MKISIDDSNRYHRQELITWWDQNKLTSASVLVVGAGALGNEVVKNLTLVGIGNIEVCDMDTIEMSNLARCVFFHESDKGKNKADVLASRASELNPTIQVTGHAKSVQKLGIGYFAKFDLVIGALDNREARAWVNQVCRKLGIPWIDGAIEGLRGIVRMFWTEGPCYHCTLSEQDYKSMAFRKSCALLAPEEILSGKTPTNATTSSIVAGIQSQEAIKYLVGMQELLSLVGACWVYVGDSMTSYVTKYQEDPECIAHDKYEELRDLGTIISMAEILQQAESDFGNLDDVVFDFEEEIVYLQPCAEHGTSGKIAMRSSLSLGAGKCETCDKNLVGTISASLGGNDPVFSLTLAELGVADNEIVTARRGLERIHYSFRRNNG